MSNPWQDDIDEMMEAFGQKVRDCPNFPPVTPEEWELRKKLIQEETQELIDAIDARDMVKIADGIIDVLVVTIGTGSCAGMDLSPLWDEVHYTNMKKVGGPKDPITGKQLKPEGWQPPDLARILED